MDSSVFLEQLRERLLAGGVDPSDAEIYVEQFGRYFDNISEEDLDEQMTSLGNIDTIVSNLIELINSKKARHTAERPQNADEDDDTNGDGMPSHIEAIADTEDTSAPEKSERVMTAEIVTNAENAARGAGFDTEPIDTEERVSSAPVTDVHGENANDTDNSMITEAAGAQTGSASNNNGQGIPSVGVQLDSNAAALGSPGAFTAVGAADTDGISAAADGAGGALITDDICPENQPAAAPMATAPPQHRAPARVLRGNTRVGLRSEPEEFLIDDAATSTREFDTVPDGFASDAYEAAYRAANSTDNMSGTVYRNIEPEYADDYDSYRPGIREYIYRGAPLEWAKLKTSESKKTFYGIVLGSLPLSLPAALLAAIAAAAIFLLDGVLFLGLALSIAGLAAIGTAFTLVSIIYGITQLGSAAPIGIYEIGIGIMSAGIALGACILIYNLLVRIMPYTFKYLVRLSTYLLYRLKCIICRFREECAKR